MAKPVGNLFVTVDVNLDKAKKAYKDLNAMSVAAGKTMQRQMGGANAVKGATQGVRRLGEEYKKAQPKIKKTNDEFRKTGDSAKKATLPLNQLQSITPCGHKQVRSMIKKCVAFAQGLGIA